MPRELPVTIATLPLSCMARFSPDPVGLAPGQARESVTEAQLGPGPRPCPLETLSAAGVFDRGSEFVGGRHAVEQLVADDEGGRTLDVELIGEAVVACDGVGDLRPCHIPLQLRHVQAGIGGGVI